MKKILLGALLAFALLFSFVSCSSQSSGASGSVPEAGSSSEECSVVSESPVNTQSPKESEISASLNIPTDETLSRESKTESAVADTMTEEDIKAHTLADGRYYNDSKYYSFTPIPDSEVNQFAEEIQFAIVEENWWDLSEMIRYPITIQGVSYQNQNEFATYSWSAAFDDDWLIGLMEETCYQMEVENDSVRMADGRIYFANVFESDGTPKLVITTINV